MSVDPLDYLQSMFPSIEGDVVAIVFAESDKDVSSTVEKLLQLVPADENRSEFPSLLPSVQPYSFLKSVSPPPPQRASSGPASVNGPGPITRPTSESVNSGWQGQQRTRRLQGPSHIPPGSKEYPPKQIKSGGRVDAMVSNNVGQPRLHGQTQSILGKRSASSNYHNRAAASQSGESVHQELFYQMGGSSVNSMPSLSSMDPYYQQPSSAMQHQKQLHHHQQQPPPPPSSQSRGNYHPQFQSPSHQSQAPPPYRGQQVQQTRSQHNQWSSVVGTGSVGGSTGVYGYPNARPNNQFYSSWMNSRQGTGEYTNQFYLQGQQNWPNIGEAELRYREHGFDTNQNPGTNYDGSYLPPGMTGLLRDANETSKSDWPLYTSGSSGAIGDHRSKMDIVSALLQPERTPVSSNSFTRQGPNQSEPSLASMTSSQDRPYREGDSQRFNKDERLHCERKDTTPVGEGKGVVSKVALANERSKDSSSRESETKDRESSGTKKLIILRGLPGSGKTTLARSLVGSNGTICCTDDFFIKNGEYVYDPSLLEECHEKNKVKARDAMASGSSPVIIDNTNTNAWEMKPYVLLAIKNGYAVEILEPDTPWRFKTSELAKRNSHRVPRYRLEKMLERYDHRVTVESIIVSHQPEKKTNRQTNTDVSKNVGSGNSSAGGGRQAANGGQKNGKSKVSPPIPRQQQQQQQQQVSTGHDDNDHTSSNLKRHGTTSSGGTSVTQNFPSGMSQQQRAGGQKGQRSNGRAMSPRPTGQKSQRLKDISSAKNGSEHNNHVTTGTSASASSAGDGKGGDSRKKVANQSHHVQQSAHTHQTLTSSKAQAEQSRKGKRTTQQVGSKSNLPIPASANKKRSVSPARGQTNKKTTPQNVRNSTKGGQNDRRREKDAGLAKSGGDSESAKKEMKSTEEEEEFVWDSSEEAEILDAGGGIGDGPVFMTDVPPAETFFKPVPHVVKPLVNGEAALTGETQRKIFVSELEQEAQRQQPPMFEVWKDSDDDEIDDSSGGRVNRTPSEGEDENPLPVTWFNKGREGHGELPRTPEVPNLKQQVDNGGYDSASCSGLVLAPSHPWERTQSARDLQDASNHSTSFIRRVQSAVPVHHTGMLTESASSLLTVDETNQDSFNTFTTSSVWGSGTGLLSSKMQLFNSNVMSSVDAIDSVVKSSPSVHSVDSADSQLDQQRRVQSSYYSMLDALTEEMALPEVVQEEKEVVAIDTDRVEECSFVPVHVHVAETKIESKLLHEAVVVTEDSVTLQQALKDEQKWPLRNKLVAELVVKTMSMKDNATQDSADECSYELDTKVDVGTLLLPTHPEQGSAVPPPVIADSAYFIDNCEAFKRDIVSDINLEVDSSLEELTEKVFDEEKLCPDQNLSTLQVALQAVAKEGCSEDMMSSSQFAAVGDVGHVMQVENFDDGNSDVSFEDPAIVSKVCLERGREEDTEVSPLAMKSLISLQEVSLSDGSSGVGSKKKASILSPTEEAEPVDVFPSAFDEGMAMNFELAAGPPHGEGPDRENSRSSSAFKEPMQSESFESPYQSQTPVNDPSEVSSGDVIDGHISRCGLEQADYLPVSAEAEEEFIDDLTSAQEATPTHSASAQPCLDDGQVVNKTESKENVASLNPDSDLLFLTECFPGLEEEYLFAIFKICNRNVEDALSVLLYSHSNQNDVAFNQNLYNAQISTDTTDDTSSTVSSTGYPGYPDLFPPPGFTIQPSDSSPEQPMGPSKHDCPKPTFSIGGFGPDECDHDEVTIGAGAERKFTPFFDASECIDDEEIARALQEQLDFEASSSELQQLASKGKDGSEKTRVADEQGRSYNFQSKETSLSSADENLELKLTASLARQLQEMFGSVTNQLPFEGEMTEDDLIVLLSERAAREIYKKWLDTLHAKKIGYRVQSEIIMTQDEALARQLQEEEESQVREKHKRKRHLKFRRLTEPSSLVSIATENYRAHHNSSPPQLGQGSPAAVVPGSPQTGRGLKEIMSEQKVQEIQENELAEVVREKAQPNLSLKLQLKELYTQFPDLEQPLVNETLVRNKFDIEATIAELKVILLHPPPPPSALLKDSIDGNVLGGTPKSGSKSKPGRSRVRGSGHGGASPAKRKLFREEDKGQQKTNEKAAAGLQTVDDKEKEEQTSYLELRAEAALHAKLRAENFMKAAHARGRKQWEVAQYYAQQGHLHTEKMAEANQRAARATLKHNYTSSDELDLHGLHVDEAIAALQEKLHTCKGSKLRVVTGQGIHSKGGGAKIRPAVINYLQQMQYKFEYERHAGALVVDIN